MNFFTFMIYENENKNMHAKQQMYLTTKIEEK